MKSKVSLLFCLMALSGSIFAVEFDLAAELYQQRNYAAAHQAFSEIAESGDPRAQTVLGLMYKYGEGVTENLDTSFNWYRRAAEQGYAPAQFHTGSMLADGLGTEQNTSVAVTWLKKAAEQGFERANEKLIDLDVDVQLERRTNPELIAWSKTWDFKLPTDLRLGEARTSETPTSQPTYLAQVGAMLSRNSADRLSRMLVSDHPELFARLRNEIRETEHDGRVIYRVHTGTFQDYSSARSFCEQLLQSTKQAGCLPHRDLSK